VKSAQVRERNCFLTVEIRRQLLRHLSQ